MTPYEIRLLLHFNSAPGMPTESQFARTDFYFSTLHSLANRDLIVEAHSTRDEVYSISPRGGAYVAALQRVPLPVQTWVMPDTYAHAQHQTEERYYHGTQDNSARDISTMTGQFSSAPPSNGSFIRAVEAEQRQLILNQTAELNRALHIEESDYNSIYA